MRVFWEYLHGIDANTKTWLLDVSIKRKYSGEKISVDMNVSDCSFKG